MNETNTIPFTASTNRQLTDTTNQLNKIAWQPVYHVNNMPQSLNISGGIEIGSSGNLLILNTNSESAIQFFSTQTSKTSPESECKLECESRRKIDIGMDDSHANKLTSNIVLKFVDALHNSSSSSDLSLSTTNSLIPATIQMIPNNLNQKPTAVQSPHSILLIKPATTIASDADDEIDDLENDETDDIEYYSDTTITKRPNKLNMQISGDCYITDIDEDESNIVRSHPFQRKSTKIRHNFSKIASSGGFGHKPSRSNSIDQLIAAAAVTSVESITLQPTESTLASSSNGEGQGLHRKNLNAIVEAIKHVEGISENKAHNNTENIGSCTLTNITDDSPSSSTTASSSSACPLVNNKSQNNIETETHKPPKKRKYTTEDDSQIFTFISEPEMQLNS